MMLQTRRGNGNLKADQARQPEDLFARLCITRRSGCAVGVAVNDKILEARRHVVMFQTCQADVSFICS